MYMYVWGTLSHLCNALLFILGTVRRFLEHFGESIDLVVFVGEESDVSIMCACVCLHLSC